MPIVPTIDISQLPWDCIPRVIRPELAKMTTTSIVAHPGDGTIIDIPLDVVQANEPSTVTSNAGIEVWEDGSYEVVFVVNTTSSTMHLSTVCTLNGANVGVLQYNTILPATLNPFTRGTVIFESLLAGTVVGIGVWGQNLPVTAPFNVTFASLSIVKRRKF